MICSCLASRFQIPYQIGDRQYRPQMPAIQGRDLLEYAIGLGAARDQKNQSIPWKNSPAHVQIGHQFRSD